MPPLGMFDPVGGFSPDLPVLLMFDEFIIDAQAVTAMESCRDKPWLGQWPEVIAYLKAEGCLHVVDIAAVVRGAGHLRSTLTQRDMRDPARWAAAMDFHDSLLNAAEAAFADSPETSQPLNWAFDPKKVSSVAGRDKHTHSLRVLLTSEPFDEIHAELVPEALQHLKMQLAEVNAGVAASMQLGAAPMFWAPYGGYLRQKSSISPAIREGVEQSSAARVFFEVAFRRFRPETVADLSRLRKDQRLSSLRAEIERAYRSGDLLEKGYPQAILQEVLRTERIVGRIRRITSWLSAPVGLIPGAGLLATAGGELAASIAESKIRGRLDWLYMISDGVGNS